MARRFGHTWWGKAWLEALENRALIDPNRLPRGRTYARQDRVRNLEVEPGLIRAYVEGTELYRSQLSVRPFSEEQWDRLLDVIVSRSAHAAALLTGELPPELDEAAREVGIELLPDAGDLGPECSCPDWAEPCKHAAALCYVVADLIDSDPFVLLLLRGRNRELVLGELRVRRSSALDLMAGARERPTPGTPAATAYRRKPDPVPPAPPVPELPGRPVRLVTEPPVDSGVVAADLLGLAADAGARAVAMLQGTGESGLDLTADEDLARRAAAVVASRHQVDDLTAGEDLARRAAASHREMDELAETAGVDPLELRARALAWTHGGRAALAALDGTWEPPPELLVAARELLGPRARVRANVVTRGRRRLILDLDRIWWCQVADDDLGWVMAGPGFPDPADALVDI